MASTDSHRQAFHAWAAHNGSPRYNTKHAAHELLRRSYPDYHVTRVEPLRVDLVGFAKAGLAIATPPDEAEYDADRTYQIPGPRLLQEPGALEDDVDFGRCAYSWEGKEFIVYDLQYEEDGCSPHYSFVLASATPEKPASARYHPDTDALLLAAGQWTKELHEEIYVFDTARWVKSSELYRSVQGASWDDVILDPTTKKNLMSDVQTFFDNRALYESMAVPWKRGLIFHGVPGNGKTVSLKALINTLARRPGDPVPSLYVKSLDAQMGPKWSIMSIFALARSMAPCLLIFEDLDSLVTNKTRSYFLNEVDGLESNEGILMIGSTNHLDRLDSAITKRPSRFDRKYHFRLPNEDERADYSRFWRAKVTHAAAAAAAAAAAPSSSSGAGAGGAADAQARATNVDFPDELCAVVAKLTEGFSFAYLKELFVMTLLSLARGETGETGDESANRDETDSEGQEKEQQKDQDTPASEASAVVVERPTAEGSKIDLAIAAVKEAKAEAGPTAATAAKREVKRVLPQVEVPEGLRDNVLLRVLTAQIKALLEDMDDSEEVSGGRDDGKGGKKKKNDKKGKKKRSPRALLDVRMLQISDDDDDGNDDDDDDDGDDDDDE